MQPLTVQDLLDLDLIPDFDAADVDLDAIPDCDW